MSGGFGRGDCGWMRSGVVGLSDGDGMEMRGCDEKKQDKGQCNN